MKWLAKRVFAGLAALLVVAVGAGALLGMQFSGKPASWAGSTGHNAAWLGGAWVNGERDRADFAELLPRLKKGGFTELYVHVGAIGPEGGVDVEDLGAAKAFLGWVERERPEVRVLGWLSHRASGSSLVEDRFDKAARKRVAAASGEVVDAGFDGVHYAVSPVTSGDPSLPDLLERTRAEVGKDRLISVDAQPLELLVGMRLPVFLVNQEELYWSKGYVQRIAEEADSIVVRGHDTGMPMTSLYGGFLVRQTKLLLDAVPQDVSVRVGAPSFQHARWGEESATETVETAAEAVRIGLTEHGKRRDDFGMALYVLDEADNTDWAAYSRGWMRPGG
ncbi:hypothetical protein CLV63_101441 [Murinocardiopsis flavida]|uniref:Glycosyl hydrolase family 18 (Putative chitinase) n=1 Tax=Murinocardiopsis flavida TaxID=645275 RepID=A0A2P8DUR9_9ACTN|nr:hypothetical protein [Murinocardiopsis flavida]PSL00962.1 hypothetical protein CLV63_101441 [Murinocardiopsis flavida]